MNKVLWGYSTNPQFDRKEAIRLLRLALSDDDDDPEKLAWVSLISAYMVGDSEGEIEMADRAVALHGSAEAGSIELRGCRRKRSGALNAPFA